MFIFSIVLLLLSLSIFVDSREVSYTIDEENIADYFLGKVAEDAKLLELLPTGDSSDVQYNILYSGNKDASWFSINDKTSALFASKSIDRDVICKYLTLVFLNLTLSPNLLAVALFTIKCPYQSQSMTGMTTHPGFQIRWYGKSSPRRPFRGQLRRLWGPRIWTPEVTTFSLSIIAGKSSFQLNGGILC